MEDNLPDKLYVRKMPLAWRGWNGEYTKEGDEYHLHSHSILLGTLPIIGVKLRHDTSTDSWELWRVDCGDSHPAITKSGNTPLGVWEMGFEISPTHSWLSWIW